MQQVCTDCRGVMFVTTRDGDIVCTGCGLVAQERIIDDTPEWRTFEDERVATIEERGWKCKLLYEVEVIDDVMKQAIDELWKLAYYPRAPCRALFTCCIYHVSKSLNRGWTVNQCINMVEGVESKAFWDVFNIVAKYCDTKSQRGKTDKKASTDSEGSELAMCKRIIYDIDTQTRSQDIIKLTKSLCDAILEKGSQGSAKSSKFFPCVVWVACCRLKVVVDEKDFCKRYDLSVKTLKKYTTVIHKICP